MNKQDKSKQVSIENDSAETSAEGMHAKERSKEVSVVEVDEDFRAPDALLKAQELGNLLDSAVKIPFIGLRVGLDFLVGLIPGIGDTIMLAASLRIVYLGYKLKIPSALRKKMIVNALIDYGLGFVPILGDLIDLFFKANQRNVRIMETWWVSENKDKIDALAKKQLDAWHEQQREQLEDERPQDKP
ncbi:DUF4112 domain-containing protein [Aestuariibacter sp. P117]|uniref:DUF4112 domain-containing protein n=2 Tax=Glaciecola petra TaxID=3075602 RepID=A0ABU2ZU86_9ALTE|nr:DUF4112 domain-containing protein [Aestuariibacter sp. P117]MDT0596202.1 DUF4112 domain-containing protein [Aestuariibacter sp. P117]